MKKILVPIDGSDNSMKALDKAKEIAISAKSDITILNVTDTSKYHISDYEAKFAEQKIEHSKELLKSSLENFKDFDGKVETVHEIGNSASEIIKLAEEGNYDLIVMGSRGLGTFSRAFLGSVSNKVLNHVNISVLIVK